MRHIFMTPSPWPLMMNLPSQEAQIDSGLAMGSASMVPSSWPVAAVHIMGVLSSEALQMSWPLVEKMQEWR
jgi:hypothetical protein